jgi:hypothetical protein
MNINNNKSTKIHIIIILAIFLINVQTNYTTCALKYLNYYDQTSKLRKDIYSNYCFI